MQVVEILLWSLLFACVVRVVGKVLQARAGYWDEWRSSDFNEDQPKPVFYLQRLLWLPLGYWGGKWRGCRVDLHKFLAPDLPDRMHTHPAWAVRIILAGGYTEEYQGEDETGVYLARKKWKPGMVGVVRPEFAHRIHRIHNGRDSWSLWLRGPIVAPIKLVGDGWPSGTQADPRAGVK